MTFKPFRTGLKPPRPGAVKLRFSTYLNFAKLPTPPTNFGHWRRIPPNGWGMLGNDQWGDCAEAAGCHQTMLWTNEGGHQAQFNTASALQNYSQLTGFNQNAGVSGNNPTDQGTDLGQMADYWQNTGFLDANGKRHKVVAVMDLNPGDLRELRIATWLFQSVTLGFNLPESAMTQTQNGEPWSIVAGSAIDGGHCVPCVGWNDNQGIGVTWGTVQAWTPGWFKEYNDQGFVALSEEMLVNARSIDGFDDQLLRADLASL
jgi:hypothetical protein